MLAFTVCFCYLMILIVFDVVYSLFKYQALCVYVINNFAIMHNAKTTMILPAANQLTSSVGEALSTITYVSLRNCDCDCHYARIIESALQKRRPEINDLDAINMKLLGLFGETCVVQQKNDIKQVWREIAQNLKPILLDKEVCNFLSRAMNSHFHCSSSSSYMSLGKSRRPRKQKTRYNWCGIFQTNAVQRFLELDDNTKVTILVIGRRGSKVMFTTLENDVKIVETCKS